MNEILSGITNGGKLIWEKILTLPKWIIGIIVLLVLASFTKFKFDFDTNIGKRGK